MGWLGTWIEKIIFSSRPNRKETTFFLTSEVYGPICNFEEFSQNLIDSSIKVGIVPADLFNLDSEEPPLFISLSSGLDFINVFNDLRLIFSKGKSVRAALNSKGYELLSDRANFSFQDQTIQYDPLTLMSFGFPFVAKKIFFYSYEKYFSESLGDLPKKVLQRISDSSYPTELVTNEIIKSHTAGYVHQLLHLNYIFDECDINNYETKTKAAVVFFVYFDSLLPLCITYLKKISKFCKVFVVSPKQDLLNKYAHVLSSQTPIEYRLQENRGRNEAAYFVTCKDVLKKFELVCLAHDKKASHFHNSLISQSTFTHCFENTLGSEALISGIIRTFDDYPYLGMLCPPFPVHSKWRGLLEDPYGVNKKLMKDLKKKMKLQEEFDDFVVAPFGGVFWVRTKAINTLIEQNFTYKDFPAEPLREDGTMLHALERIYPEIIKQNGFACGFVLSRRYCEIYIDNIIYNLKNYQNIIKKENDISFYDFLKKKIKKKPKLHLFCYSVKYFFKSFLNSK